MTEYISTAPLSLQLEKVVWCGDGYCTRVSTEGWNSDSQQWDGRWAADRRRALCSLALLLEKARVCVFAPIGGKVCTMIQCVSIATLDGAKW